MAYGLEHSWWTLGGLGGNPSGPGAGAFMEQRYAPFPGFAGEAGDRIRQIQGADSDLSPDLDGAVDGASAQADTAQDTSDRLDWLSQADVTDQYGHADAALDEAAGRNSQLQQKPNPARPPRDHEPGEPPDPPPETSHDPATG